MRQAWPGLGRLAAERQPPPLESHNFLQFCWGCGWLVTVKGPLPRLKPRLSRHWQEWKAIPQCQLSYGLIENTLKNLRYVLPDLKQGSKPLRRNGRLNDAIFLRATDTKTFSWQSSWWWKHLRIPFHATHWIHMSLDLAWWRNGWMKVRLWRSLI